MFVVWSVPAKSKNPGPSSEAHTPGPRGAKAGRASVCASLTLPNHTKITAR